MSTKTPPDASPVGPAVGKRNRTPLILVASSILAAAIAAVWLLGGSDVEDEPVSFTTTFTERCVSTGAEPGYVVYTCQEVSPDPRWAGTATLWYSEAGNRFELTNDGGTWSGTSRAVRGGYQGSGLGSGGYEGLQYRYEGSLPRPITFNVTVEPIP